MRTLGAGETIAGRFRLERWAGSGAFGTVFQARDLSSGALVALKLLDHLAPEVRARFEREARIVAALDHPAIVRYVAHGTTTEQRHFLAIEWLEGEDLQGRLRRGPMTVAEAVALTRALAGGLAAAHDAGIVHRDLKPANIFLVDGDPTRPCILDFGVSHVDAATMALTHDGAVVGTPGYMAPEQARGEDVVPASDLFSLGCVLYEAVTGRPAFRGRGALELLAKVLLEPTPRLRELRPDAPAALEELIDRLLAKSPLERPVSASAVASTIDRHLSMTGSGDGDGDGDVTGEAPAIASRAIGPAEQTLMSIIMASPHTIGDADASTDHTVDAVPVAAEIAAAARVAADHGFAVAKLASDGLLCSLQRGGAATDLAARAARTALAMRQVAPSIGLVLATGRALVGDAIPIGEVIDGAATALRHATVGSAIVVDALTADLLERSFEIVAGPGGRSLRGELGSGDVVRRLCGMATPCVGRERELASLSAMWRECLDEPAARAVLVVGPAGAGKSRLRYEMLRTVGTEARVLFGHADPVNAGAPFGLLAEAVRRSAGLHQVAAAEAWPRLTAHVGEHLGAGDRERVTLFLGEMLGLPFDAPPPALAAARSNPIVMADQIRAAWEDYLAATLARGPVLIILEDLHWGDLPSVNLVDAALRLLRDQPLFVLALARAEVHQRFPDLWSSHARQDLSLVPLGKRAAEQLIRTVLPDATPTLAATLVDQAGGNAFFLEELIRAAADGRTSGFPATAIAMAQARIDGLGDESRRVLRAAAVLGETFWAGAAAALLGAEDGPARAEVEHAFERLATDEIVTRRRQSRIAGEIELTFRHALVREAAYATLTDADRELGHRLAADWLEAAGEHDPLALAEHRTRGQQPARAIPWLHRAAEHALEGNDYVAALERVERAREAGARGPVRGALELIAAEAHKWRGEWSAQAAAGHTAMSCLDGGGAAWCAAVAGVAFGAGRTADRDSIVGLAGELAAVAAPPSPAMVTASVFVAIEARYLGLLAEAETLFDRAEACAAMFPDDHLMRATLYRARAFRARFTGDMAAAARWHRDASDEYGQAGASRQSCQERYNVADSLVTLGVDEQAEVALGDVIAECQRRGLHSILPYAHHALGVVRLHQQRLDEAAVELERAQISFAVGGGNRRGEQVTRNSLARVMLAAGDLAGAEREARAGVAQAATPLGTATCEATLARILLASDRTDDAVTTARAAAGRQAAQAGSEDIFVPVTFAVVLDAAGLIGEAIEVATAAHRRLLEMAARIGDATSRACFLERVAEHIELIALLARLTPAPA